MDTNGKDKVERAYRAERERMRSWLSGKVGDESAEDILHDVFARAFMNLDALEPVRDLAAWLWRSARNAVIDAWRSRSRGLSVARGSGDELDELMDDAWADAGDETARGELLEALDRAIRSLPPEQREVVTAQCLGGETFRSLSLRTGVPIDTLASRKRYALAKIREALVEFY